MDKPEHPLITLNINEYANIYLKKQRAEYARIILNVPDAVHEVMNNLLRQTYLEHCQTFRMEHFAKRIMPDCWCGIRNVSRQEEGGGTRAL